MDWIVEEQLLGDDRAKSAAANDDRVELGLGSANSPCRVGGVEEARHFDGEARFDKKDLRKLSAS